MAMYRDYERCQIRDVILATLFSKKARGLEHILLAVAEEIESEVFQIGSFALMLDLKRKVIS